MRKLLKISGNFTGKLLKFANICRLLEICFESLRGSYSDPGSSTVRHLHEQSVHDFSVSSGVFVIFGITSGEYGVILAILAPRVAILVPLVAILEMSLANLSHLGAT